MTQAWIAWSWHNKETADPRALSREEAQFYDTLKHPQRRHDFLQSRYLLRRLLTSNADLSTLTLSLLSNGRPCINSSNFHVSLSHTHEAAAVIIATAPCGIDIEGQQARDHLALAKRFFSDSEFQTLSSLPSSAQLDYFYALWTLKEAGVKALGSTLSQQLKQLRFERDSDSEWQSSQADIQCWHHTLNASATKAENHSSMLHISATTITTESIDWRFPIDD